MKPSLSKQIVIGITGKKGSGKDTIAEFIREYLVMEYGFLTISLHYATLLKESLCELLDVSMEELERYKRGMLKTGPAIHNGFHFSVRQMMQRYGTEAHRNIFGENFWVDQLNRLISAGTFQEYDVIVIPDVRFDNEASNEKIDLVIEVRKRDQDNNDNHLSEKGINSELVDYVIVNDDSLDDLEVSVISLLEEEILCSYLET